MGIKEIFLNKSSQVLSQVKPCPLGYTLHKNLQYQTIAPYHHLLFTIQDDLRASIWFKLQNFGEITWFCPSFSNEI